MYLYILQAFRFCQNTFWPTVCGRMGSIGLTATEQRMSLGSADNSAQPNEREPRENFKKVQQSCLLQINCTLFSFSLSLRQSTDSD